MSKPWQSYEEFQTDQSLTNAISTPDQIRSIRPPQSGPLIPNSRGVIKQEPTIMEILDINRYGKSNNKLLSGFPVRRTMVDDQWSGAGRYSMEALG